MRLCVFAYLLFLLQVLRPALPVFLYTGYAEDLSPEELREAGAAEVVASVGALREQRAALDAFAAEPGTIAGRDEFRGSG